MYPILASFNFWLYIWELLALHGFGIFQHLCFDKLFNRIPQISGNFFAHIFTQMKNTIHFAESFTILIDIGSGLTRVVFNSQNGDGSMYRAGSLTKLRQSLQKSSTKLFKAFGRSTAATPNDSYGPGGMGHSSYQMATQGGGGWVLSIARIISTAQCDYRRKHFQDLQKHFSDLSIEVEVLARTWKRLA